MGLRRGVTSYSTWQMEQTRRPMEGHTTVIFNVQTVKCSREIFRLCLNLDPGARARTGFSH